MPVTQVRHAVGIAIGMRIKEIRRRRQGLVIQGRLESPELDGQIVVAHRGIGLGKHHAIGLAVGPVEAILQPVVDVPPPVGAVGGVDAAAEVETIAAGVDRPLQGHPELVHLVFAVEIVRGHRAVEAAAGMIAVEA